MKKVILASLLFIAAGIQSIAAPRIVLADNKDHYHQTETGYTLEFKLIATSAELSEIVAQTATIADRATLNLAEGSGNTYDCYFVVNHQNQPEYVHKMLLTMGIADLEYKGNVQSLETIIQILYSYL